MSADLSQRESYDSALPPPRFTLRTLWLAMTLLCCLFALMSAIGSLWSVILIFCATLILAHVVGNSLGTRLRDRASQQILIEGGNHAAPPLVAPLVAAPQRLTRRTRLHWITLATGVGGGLCGAVLGGVGSAAVYPQAPMAAIALGIVSASVLGALAGFAISSFVSVFRQAMSEALGACEPAGPRVVPDSPR